MAWECEVCGTTDVNKAVVYVPPRCWDCLDPQLKAKKIQHNPVFYNLLQEANQFQLLSKRNRVEHQQTNCKPYAV